MSSNFNTNRVYANNCAIREQDGDGKPVGRCWHFIRTNICERHGDVTEVQKTYKETGFLTNDCEHIRVFPE